MPAQIFLQIKVPKQGQQHSKTQHLVTVNQTKTLMSILRFDHGDI